MAFSPQLILIFQLLKFFETLMLSSILEYFPGIHYTCFWLVDKMLLITSISVMDIHGRKSKTIVCVHKGTQRALYGPLFYLGEFQSSLKTF